MKKIIGLAVLATAAGVGAASAEGTVSANVALVSDYVFRGVSLSDNGPAIQGGFDYEAEMFYTGVWASNVIDGIEIDVYGGFTPSTGPIDWDLGAIAYFYPGADDDGAEFDYVELKAEASHDFTEQFTAGAAVYYAPENYGDTGDALYLEINGAFQVTDAFAVDAAYGNQNVEEPAGPGTEDDYNTWNVGATWGVHGFELDLRYHDTDIEAGSNIEAYTYGESSYDAAVVVTVGRTL
ncbi:MAG: TorF family putative porin [Caulobacteraceae bacterium]